MPQKRNLFFRNNSFGSPLSFLFWLVGPPMNLEGYQDPLASPLGLVCGQPCGGSLTGYPHTRCLPHSLGPPSIGRSTDTFTGCPEIWTSTGASPARWISSFQSDGKKRGSSKDCSPAGSCLPQGRQVPPARIHAGHRPPVHVDLKYWHTP